MEGALDRYASHYLFLYASGVRCPISICSESFYFSWLYTLCIIFYTVKNIFTGFLLAHSAFVLSDYCKQSPTARSKLLF